jgi:hypothetical protein
VRDYPGLMRPLIIGEQASVMIARARASALRNLAKSRQGILRLGFNDLVIERTNDALCRSEVILLRIDTRDDSWTLDGPGNTGGSAGNETPRAIRRWAAWSPIDRAVEAIHGMHRRHVCSHVISSMRKSRYLHFAQSLVRIVPDHRNGLPYSPRANQQGRSPPCWSCLANAVRGS